MSIDKVSEQYCSSKMSDEDMKWFHRSKSEGAHVFKSVTSWICLSLLDKTLSVGQIPSFRPITKHDLTLAEEQAARWMGTNGWRMCDGSWDGDGLRNDFRARRRAQALQYMGNEWRGDSLAAETPRSSPQLAGIRWEQITRQQTLVFHAAGNESLLFV